MSRINACRLLFTFFVCCVSFTPFPANAQVKEATSKKVQGIETDLQQVLDEFIKEEKVPGATLAVAMSDGSVVAVGSGVVEQGKPAKMPKDAGMFCGSTGKTFVSAVTLQLVAEGKIDLDKKIATYFPGKEKNEWLYKLPGADQITVRQLLNHTSGIPRYVFSRKFVKSLKDEPLKSRSPKENLALLHGRKSVHPPGKGWAYSDSNYLVLGLLIEKVSGKSFYENCRKRFLEPLRLTATKEATSENLPTLSQGHIGSANPFGLAKKVVSNGKYCINPDFEWCGGGYVTNTSDLASWVQAIHSGEKVLKKDQYKQLVTPSSPPANLGGAGYGLGTFIWKSDLGTFYGHAGMMPGYLTQIEYCKRGNFTIAFQVNSDEGFGRNHHTFVQKVAKMILEKK